MSNNKVIHFLLEVDNLHNDFMALIRLKGDSNSSLDLLNIYVDRIKKRVSEISLNICELFEDLSKITIEEEQDNKNISASALATSLLSAALLKLLLDISLINKEDMEYTAGILTRLGGESGIDNEISSLASLINHYLNDK